MLILQNDINTKGYANWFSFKVYSVSPGPLKFHLVNLQKIFSFFSQGMKPVVYSLREGKGWKMEGHNIGYYRGDLLKVTNAILRPKAALKDTTRLVSQSTKNTPMIYS